MADPSYEDAQRTLRHAMALRDNLRRTLEDAARAAPPAHPTLPTRAPRSWLRTRLRHPLWSLGTVARMPMRVGTVRKAAEWFGRRGIRTEPLPLTLPRHAWNEPRRVSGALYWLGPVAIRHRTMAALLCQPDSSIECRLTAAPGAAFRCACGVAPRAWSEAPPAVEFTVRIASASRAWVHEAVLHIDVTVRITDRKWHDVRIDLPDITHPRGEEIVVTLSTAVARGSDARHAEALFGEPRLVWRR